MKTFTQYAPTEVIFGKGAEAEAGRAVKRWGGSSVMLVYGGGSVVRSGLLDRVKESLEAEGISYVEYGGVKPNPRLAFAEAGVKKASEAGVDFILAIGGGSAIDTAKAIAHGTADPDADLWEIWTMKAQVKKSMPVAAILTISAAGSEMSDSAVLTNEETGEKRGINTPFNRCKFAIMNPELTFTLPKYQLGCGICDIMMHTMERYFIPDSEAMLTDEIAEGLLRTVIASGRIAMKDQTDYNAMAEIMWCSSISHNGLTGCGRDADFSVHKMGQAIGGKYDIAHGATLSALWGSWARYLYKECPHRFARFARKVWGVTEVDDLKAAELGIDATVAYFKEIGMPVSLGELGVEISEEDIMEMAADSTRNDTVKLSKIRPLGTDEAAKIFRAAM